MDVDRLAVQCAQLRPPQRDIFDDALQLEPGNGDRVADRDRGEELIDFVATLLPEGPTTFVRKPWVDAVEELSPSLVRIALRTTTAPGREWLVESFFSDLLKEKAEPGLIVHGPIVLAVDETASRSFARASAAMRWQARREAA